MAHAQARSYDMSGESGDGDSGAAAYPPMPRGANPSTRMSSHPPPPSSSPPMPGPYGYGPPPPGSGYGGPAPPPHHRPPHTAPPGPSQYRYVEVGEDSNMHPSRPGMPRNAPPPPQSMRPDGHPMHGGPTGPAPTHADGRAVQYARSYDLEERHSFGRGGGGGGGGGEGYQHQHRYDGGTMNGSSTSLGSGGSGSPPRMMGEGRREDFIRHGRSYSGPLPPPSSSPRSSPVQQYHPHPHPRDVEMHHPSAQPPPPRGTGPYGGSVDGAPPLPKPPMRHPQQPPMPPHHYGEEMQPPGAGSRHHYGASQMDGSQGRPPSREGYHYPQYPESGPPPPQQHSRSYSGGGVEEYPPPHAQQRQYRYDDRPPPPPPPGPPPRSGRPQYVREDEHRYHQHYRPSRPEDMDHHPHQQPQPYRPRGGTTDDMSDAGSVASAGSHASGFSVGSKSSRSGSRTSGTSSFANSRMTSAASQLVHRMAGSASRPPPLPPKEQEPTSPSLPPRKPVASNNGSPPKAPSPVEGGAAADPAKAEDLANMGCTCKKSKCLKLYCQCFAGSIMCGPNCRCLTCMNTPQHDPVRKEAIKAILSRNPGAFDTKFKATEEGGDGTAHKLGCKCRKSACLKKYCECYNASVKCSGNCRCIGCQNMPPGGLDGGSRGSQAVQVRSFAADVANVKKSTKQKGSPEPWVMENAAKNLAFMKGASPQRPEHKAHDVHRTTEDRGGIPSMPSLASSEVSPVDPDDASYRNPQKVVAEEARLSKPPTPDSASKVSSKAPSDVISPDTEKKAGTVVNTLLMAASALTELNGSNPASPQSAQMRKEVIEIPKQMLPARPGTPQRPGERRASHSSPIINRSPKRKSSFDSDCPTPKRQSSFESDGYSPDIRNRKKFHDILKNTGSISLQEGTSNAVLIVDSRSDAEQDPARQKNQGPGMPAKMQPFTPGVSTPPVPPKLKLSRFGSIKRTHQAGSPFVIDNQTPPRPPANAAGIDSTTRPFKIPSDSDADDASSSDGSNDGSSVNKDNAHVFRNVGERASTPPAETTGVNTLTPVSSRIEKFRKLEVSDGDDGKGNIGMEVELKQRT